MVEGLGFKVSNIETQTQARLTPSSVSSAVALHCPSWLQAWQVRGLVGFRV